MDVDPSAAASAPATGPRALTVAASLAAVAALTALAYANVLHGAFVVDDLKELRDNPLIRELGNYALGGPGYRALPNRWIGYVTFALNYRLGGLDVTGFHLFNVIVHALNGALVYALVLVTFRTERLRASSLARSAPAVALVAAALFVAHPLQTQAVTYVVQRLTSLATFFYLATVVLYAAWRLRRERGDAAGAAGISLYAAALVCALLAVKTKEIAFTLPAALALYELSFFGPARRRWALLLPFVVAAALIPIGYLDIGRASHGGGLSAARPLALPRIQTTVGRLDYLRTELPVVVSYLGLLLLPAGQSVDHDFPIQRSFAAPDVASALAVLLAFVALGVHLAYRTRRSAARPMDGSGRLVAFCVGWAFLTLSVESSVIPIVDVMNEHRAYLPSVGFFVAAGVVVVLLARRLAPARPGAVAVALGAVYALLLAAATHGRNRVWNDPVSLWADAAKKAPAKARPHHLLGSALVEAGRREEALEPLRRAVALDPGLPWAREQLGAVLLALGRADEAEPHLREALRLRDDYPEAAFNLAVLLWRAGRTEESRRWFQRFLEIAPAAYSPRARELAAARVAER